jgi:hypothetical protein
MRSCLLSVAVVAVILSGAGAWAADPAPEPALVTFVYSPPADLVDQRKLQANVTDVLLSDTSTRMTGCATATVKLSTREISADGPTTTMRVEIAQMRQQMAGRTLNSPLPKPALLRLDSHARLIGLPTQDAQAAGEIISQGGLPLQALAVICGMPQLPDQGVALGATWQRTDSYNLPGLGQAKLEMATTFVSLKDGLATFRSNIRIHVPDFDADNPLLPGEKVKIHNMVVDLTDLTQQYEVARSVVSRADSGLKAQLEAVSPDITLPLKLTATVSYAPAG